MQALEQEYGCQLCIGPCTTRGEVRADFVVLALCNACVKVDVCCGLLLFAGVLL